MVQETWLENALVLQPKFKKNTPKLFMFTKKIKESYPTASHTRLTDVCCTCWLARINGLEIFIEPFVAVV